MSKATPRNILMFPLAAGACALLAGCGSPGGYPSLAKRPIELSGGRITGAMKVVPGPKGPAPLSIPLPADLPARLARLESDAQAAHGRFEEKRGHATALVSAARGAAVASESWSVAQVAIADLESTRSDTMIALADLDQLYIAQRIDGGDGSPIAAVRDKVTAWVADEDAVLAGLR